MLFRELPLNSTRIEKRLRILTIVSDSVIFLSPLKSIDCDGLITSFVKLRSNDFNYKLQVANLLSITSRRTILILRHPFGIKSYKPIKIDFKTDYKCHLFWNSIVVEEVWYNLWYE